MKLDHELTCAGLDALEPRVIKSRVAVIAALLEPSTAGSTTTGKTIFLAGDTLGTYT